MAAIFEVNLKVCYESFNNLEFLFVFIFRSSEDGSSWGRKYLGNVWCLSKFIQVTHTKI